MASVEDRRAADQERIETIDPGYLTRVRVALARLGRRDLAGDRTATALADLQELAEIDVDVPTRSRVPPAALLKAAIKRLVGWYLRYLADQVSAYGRSAVVLGEMLAGRAERLEGRTAALQADVEELRRRVERLEGSVPAGGGEPPGR